DAHRVHAILYDGIERAGQLRLADIVLILTDTDGLRIDLHQLGERILETAGNGHRAAQADVDIGKLTRGELGSRVHGRTRLGNHDLRQFELGMLLDQLAGEFVRFAGGGPVADADEVD